MNKNVLKQLSYGMYAISTLDNGRDVGCIANSVMQVTYDTVVVSLNLSTILFILEASSSLTITSTIPSMSLLFLLIKAQYEIP